MGQDAPQNLPVVVFLKLLRTFLQSLIQVYGSNIQISFEPFQRFVYVARMQRLNSEAENVSLFPLPTPRKVDILDAFPGQPIAEYHSDNQAEHEKKKSEQGYEPEFHTAIYFPNDRMLPGVREYAGSSGESPLGSSGNDRNAG